MNPRGFLIFAAAVLGSLAMSAAEPVILEGPALKKAVATAGAAKVLPSADVVTVQTGPGNRTAFYQQKLQWRTADIGQIVFTVKADKPGRLRFVCNTQLEDGKRLSVGIFRAVKPDGDFHDYGFPVGLEANWRGVMTNYELRWFGEEAEVALKKIAASDRAELELNGSELVGKLLVFKAKELKTQDGVAARTAGPFGGFYQQGLKWEADRINTVIFRLRSNQPGTLLFACSMKSPDGKPLGGLSLATQQVPGDGKFHEYVFYPGTHPKHTGIITNYELRFTGPEAELAVSMVKATQTAGLEKKSPDPAVTAVEAPSARPVPTALYSYSPADVKRHVRLARMKSRPSPEALTGESPLNVAGSFYQDNMALDTAKIAQIEYKLSATAPGYFCFYAGCRTADGKRGFARTPPVAAVPDGKFHTYIFPIGEHPAWQGTLTNWELRWMGDEPALLGMKSFRAVKERNLIADAAALPVDAEVVTGKLMPRAKAQLNYLGGTCPGVTLRFYDRDFQELPGTAVKLGAGAKSVDFTTPEMMIETRVTVHGASGGFPQLVQKEYLPPLESGNALSWRGNWLWIWKKPGPINRNIWFERKFTLDEQPEFAVMSAVGDDSCFVYVNGHHMGHTRKWNISARYDITKYLKKGENVISCRVKNIDSWGGFLADVYVETPGRKLYFDTDEKWLCESDSNTDRAIPAGTRPAAVLGNSAIPPWNGSMSYRYAGPQGELSLLKSEPGKMTVKVEKLPVTELKRLRFIVENEAGKKHEFMLSVTPGSAAWKVGETLELRYQPPYFDHGKAKLYCQDDFVRIKDNPVLQTFDRPAAPPPLRRARWVGGARPMLQMDDEIINPIFWNAYGPIRRLVPLLMFRNNNFQSYRIGIKFEEFWMPDGSFDFTEFDNKAATLLTIAPNAVFSIHVGSFMPEWWLERNPDDLSTHENNRPRDLWLDKQALGSQKWLTEGEIPLKALIDHIKQSNYADRVWGLSFTENNCGEWFWTSADATKKISYAGYSPSDLASFRRYLRKKYATDAALAKAWAKPGLTFDQVAMPSHELARKGTVGELLDPAKDMAMIDFFTFRSLVLAEALIHFGKFTKEQTDGKWLTGAYYGYFSEMIANWRRNIQSNGHNGFMETVKSPYVDFFHAPQRYTLRKTGQPGALMHVWDPYVLRGKVVYDELDLRNSYTARRSPDASDIIYCGTPDTPQCDIGQFYRSFGTMLATGTLMYWYDLDGGQFDEKAINEAIAFCNDVYMKLGPVKNTTPYEVAVVNSRDSVWYTKYAASDNPTTIASEAIYKHVNELAVPFRNVMVDDLLDPDVKLEALKVYIMHPMIMLTQAEREGLMARFAREKAVVVWLYAAGCSYPDHGPSAENCGDFLGMRFRMEVAKAKPAMTLNKEFGGLVCENDAASSPWFYPVDGFDRVVGRTADGKAAMVAKKIGGATHYFCTLTNLPPRFYAGLLDKYRVHRYSKEENRDQFWIGNDVVFLHASGDGERSLILPEGTYAEGIVGPVPKKLASGETFPVRAGMTYGFHIVKGSAKEK